MSKIIGVTVGTPLSASSVANAIKGSATGNPIIIDDSSPLEHEMKVEVAGKNLFDNDTSKIKALTFISATGETVSKIGCEFILPVGTYTIHAERIGEIQEDFIYGWVVDKDNVVKEAIRIVEATVLRTVTFTIAEGDILKIYSGNSTIVPSCRQVFNRYNKQIEVGTTATAYTPFIANEDISVTKYGKNLFANDFEQLKEITFIGSDGTEYKRIGYDLNLPVGDYVSFAELKPDQSASGYLYGYVTDAENNIKKSFKLVQVNLQPPQTFKVESGDVVKLLNNSSTNASLETQIGYAKALFEKFNVQIECGKTKTDFEPYIKPITRTADGNGNVGGIMANGEAMTLIADNEATISAEYNKDLNKAFAELQNAIATLGSAAVAIPEEV